MSDFSFDFEKVQKQVAFADLTEEQIRVLLSTLQKKQSAKLQGVKASKAMTSM